MISFHFEGELREFNIEIDNSDLLSERDIELAYEDMLDECYGTVKVAGFSYDTSYLLKSVDPIAFRCGLSDYISEENYIEVHNENRFIGYITADTAERLIEENESESEADE